MKVDPYAEHLITRWLASKDAFQPNWPIEHVVVSMFRIADQKQPARCWFWFDEEGWHANESWWRFVPGRRSSGRGWGLFEQWYSHDTRDLLSS